MSMSNKDVAFAKLVVAVEIKKYMLMGAVPRCECEDLASDVMTELVKEWPRLNAARGSVEAFINRVVQTRLVSILRCRCAIKRGGGSRHSESLPHDLVDRAGAHRDWTDLIDMRIDLEEARGTLTPEQQSLCDELRHDTVSRVAQLMGTPRRTLRDAVSRIRNSVRDRGLEEYLK